jgi:hypothetical protein
MATRSLSPSFVIGILAKQASIKAVKRDMQSRGVKLSYVSPKDIRIVAQEYLAAHPELLAQAAELIERSPALSRLCKSHESGHQFFVFPVAPIIARLPATLHRVEG